MHVISALNPGGREFRFPVSPGSMSVLSGSRHTAKPRKYLGYYVGIKCRLAFLDGRPEAVAMVVPEDMLNGGSQFSRLTVSVFRGLLVTEAGLRLRNVFERRIDFHVIHKQGNVISSGDVINTQAAVPQFRELLLGLANTLLPFGGY